MKRTLALTGVLLAGFVLPAAAQTSTFYIVQDTGTKKCSIVEQRPTTTTSVIVGGDKVYKTRTEAETGMKTVKVCETVR